MSMAFFSFAQEGFPINGMKQTKSIVHAYVGATVQTSYDSSPSQKDILVKDGKIIKVGSSLSIPENAVVHNVEGTYIYPGFIELNSDYGQPEVKRSEWTPRPQIESKTPGAYHWNEAIKPEYRASENFQTNGSDAKSLRKMGFGASLSHRKDGIARGTGTLVSLHDEVHSAIIKPDASAHYSFSKGSSRQSYPSSLMGMIALLKQTYHDANWYAAGGNKEDRNLSLEAWNANQALPQFFDPLDYLSALRADKLGDEFGVQYIIYGSGEEYKRIEDVKSTNATFVVPLGFPDAYDVEDPYLAEFVNLSQLKHWELAPANLAMLEKAGVSFAISASNSEDFWSEMNKAIAYGLSEKAALKALTHTPAKLLGAENVLGSLSAGKLANFNIFSEPLFSEDMELLSYVVHGDELKLKEKASFDIRGSYALNILDKTFELKITGSPERPKAKITLDSTEFESTFKLELKAVYLNLYHDSIFNGNIRLTGFYDDESMSGTAQKADGNWVKWTASLKEEHELSNESENKGDKEEKRALGEVWYPNMAYGYTSPPSAKATLFKNATVWTSSDEGILENTDVAILNGKIIAIGKDLEARAVFRAAAQNLEVIDATGKHITAGIIDEHSHIAISRGVNESGQNSSAEVSIADVVNPDDVNIYRQLAGGVTAAQLLHGSANPIGGQSAIIKMRWGSNAEDMKIKDAAPFIKFALGENVKQSNWGDYNTIRYPQTRMGVEQTFYDYFWRAKRYEKAKADAKRSGKPFRVDLEMETLVQILNSERFISCHSYIQSEINMLMHVADSMGFTLNTFTHILEGYKVADKMKAHGAGASTFSDWWAYKYEVNEAIPYNASILNEVGVTVAINSDDAEMARRLNQEAAKSVKYGGMSEEDAWNMVTINPAKLLHIDHRTGSLEEGKDADIVLWSDNPLSIYAIAEKTFVDGKCLYDRSKDQEQANRIREERSRIVQLMLDAKAGGARVQKVEPVPTHHYHCDTLEDH